MSLKIILLPSLDCKALCRSFPPYMRTQFCLVTCFSYDPRENKWTTLADMSVARALAGCAVFRNKIYIIGQLPRLATSSHRHKSRHHTASIGIAVYVRFGVS